MGVICIFQKIFYAVRAKFLSNKLGTEVRIVKYKYRGEPIEGQELKELLNKIISPRVSELGLKWRGDYLWISENINGIRHIVEYGRFTRSSNRGYISWGVALDFVMVPKGKNLVFNRTEKTAIIHIGEWSKGYADSFLGVEMVDGKGVASHYEQIAERTITEAIDGELENISSFFEKVKNIEGIIQIVNEQINNPKSPIYKMKFPSPTYILAFIYAKLGQFDLANKYLKKDTFLSDEKNQFVLNLIEKEFSNLSSSNTFQ
ncbi:hypothetical protein GCM10008018_43910 [Paenibacillus marchantiophytorum]|uniref:DUF4304 domain-containing protein n=1 Tax=Paenibacillus marchantiophytorum TaxID=1619310 RepID=A0ABQ1EYR7_9BACL|nr:hypothetical protein [Paenibacillus marchantiophytorum]GFZ92666.1 hypothetical protein GCM10008018_43910 [Paenibacillus marchantiophytorum]